MNKRIKSLNALAIASQTVLIIWASFCLLVYLFIALKRLSYPFELEWMEGGSVVQVQRVLDGLSLYVTPSLNFTPFIYTPLYFYVSSLFANITGNGFFPLRLVSYLSSLGCLTFIFMIVHRRTRSFYASFIASCLFAATFRISGAWFDIARVDSLFLFLLLAAIYTFDSTRMVTRSLISPLLLFLSFFTKQTALPIALFFSVAVLICRKRVERLCFPLIFSLLMAVSFFIMNPLTAGWYRYYVFDLPAQHEIFKPMIIGFWKYDILQYLPIALVVCAVPFSRLGSTTNSKTDRIIQDIIILGSMFMASYLSRLHSGGYSNVLMPVYAGVAIYLGIGLALLLKAMDGHSIIKTILLLAITVQFALLHYPYKQQIPSQMDNHQGVELQQVISRFKGEVYLSDHPWYIGNLNKPSQAQDMAVRDILRASSSGQWKHIFAQEMAAAVAKTRYEAFIVDFKDFPLRPRDFETYYKLVESNLSGSAFHPVTGWDRRPTYLYVRRIVLGCQ